LSDKIKIKVREKDCSKTDSIKKEVNLNRAKKNNPNIIELNMNMKKTAYAEAKIGRIDILIENCNSDPEKEYYETVKKLYLKQLPKRSLNKKAKDKEKEIVDLNEDMDYNNYAPLSARPMKEREETSKVLYDKQEKLLAELAELNELITPKESEE